MIASELRRYHPFFVFNQFGDIERALFRNENVYNGRIKSVETCAIGIVLYISATGIIMFGNGRCNDE